MSVKAKRRKGGSKEPPETPPALTSRRLFDRLQMGTSRRRDLNELSTEEREALRRIDEILQIIELLRGDLLLEERLVGFDSDMTMERAVRADAAHQIDLLWHLINGERSSDGASALAICLALEHAEDGQSVCRILEGLGNGALAAALKDRDLLDRAYAAWNSDVMSVSQAGSRGKWKLVAELLERAGRKSEMDPLSIKRMWQRKQSRALRPRMRRLKALFEYLTSQAHPAEPTPRPSKGGSRR